ncbi:MAG: cell division protein CrgA [Marmoricola sp.]
MSRDATRNSLLTTSGYETSVVRTAVPAVLVVLGVAWIVVYVLVARDAALFSSALGGTRPHTSLPWMSDLVRWNYLIGFGLILLGLAMSADRLTPLGRGQGVVVGMLFCFLFGLAWIVVYYFLGTDAGHFAVMDDLQQYNLVVGIGFMAVGFTFATKWE